MSSSPAINLPDDAAQTRQAAVLGWTMTELLGTAYMTKETPPKIPWSGNIPHALPLAIERSLQEQRLTLVARMESAAQALGQDKLVVPDDDRHIAGAGQQYLDIVRADVTKLGQREPLLGEGEIEAVRSDLNRRLYL